MVTRLRGYATFFQLFSIFSLSTFSTFFQLFSNFFPTCFQLFSNFFPTFFQLFFQFFLFFVFYFIQLFFNFFQKKILNFFFTFFSFFKNFLSSIFLKKKFNFFSNFFILFFHFFSTHVTVTSVTWLRLPRHMVRKSLIYTVAWVRGYATFLSINMRLVIAQIRTTIVGVLVWSSTGYCNREWTFSFLLKIKIGTCSPREGCEKKSYVHNQETNNNMDKIVVKKWKISWKKLTTIKERCKKG